MTTTITRDLLAASHQQQLLRRTASSDDHDEEAPDYYNYSTGTSLSLSSSSLSLRSEGQEGLSLVVAERSRILARFDPLFVPEEEEETRTTQAHFLGKASSTDEGDNALLELGTTLATEREESARLTFRYFLPEQRQSPSKNNSSLPTASSQHYLLAQEAQRLDQIIANLPPIPEHLHPQRHHHSNKKKEKQYSKEPQQHPRVRFAEQENHLNSASSFVSKKSKRKSKKQGNRKDSSTTTFNDNNATTTRAPSLDALPNVTALSRSLIPARFFANETFVSSKRNHNQGTNNNNIMSSNKNDPNNNSSSSLGSSSKGLFRRMSGRRGRSEDSAPEIVPDVSAVNANANNITNNNAAGAPTSPKSPSRRAHSADDDDSAASTGRGSSSRGRQGMFGRLRDRSRSRSKSRKRDGHGADGDGSNSGGPTKEMLVAVTSCRSDGYYNQKAPGSTAKLPRKAPANLKLFHELAVGVKDAYAAVGETPKKPEDNDDDTRDYQGQRVLWEFVGNLDFLLALVDEVAVDSVTRGALKDDSTFKGLRDVIKKGNRVLEEMLVRRERKYTLFFRLVSARDANQIERIQSWNLKVEKAVGAITDDRSSLLSGSESETDSTSVSNSTAGSSVSSRAGVFSRGRQLLPTAGRVRSRRATPTPRMRNRKGNDDNSLSDSASDGFSAVTKDPMASSSSVSDYSSDDSEGMLPSGLRDKIGSSRLQATAQVQPKDELVDVIRGLRVEKISHKESQDEELAQLKPNWQPKADIPLSVPKLPMEYVHRHRLMKQVVSCLLGETEARAPDGSPQNSVITCVTSRHGDKAGNGKSTLAVAVIQTVEIRERFVDGIAWLKLGRNPLGDRDIRRLYEELYRQLVVKETDIDASVSERYSEGGDDSYAMRGQESMGSLNSEAGIDRTVERADSVRRFQGGDLEGIKEDLGRMLVARKVLICLDDVWRVDDAKWFIFESTFRSARESPYKVLITTRVASLLGAGAVQEVFVRILSEHEAVKLLLSTAGRRPYGGRNSAVFHQSKLVVKGCGNSPLGILLVGSMLRNSNRNWSMSSPVWTGIFNQCSLNLEEAAQLRSFKNSLTRIVDASFFTLEDPLVRVALRRCFVLFAMAFRGNDWMLSGKGIPQAVCLEFFSTVVAAGPSSKEEVDSEFILSTLENLKLVSRAGHRISPPTTREADKDASESSDRENGDSERDDWDDFDEVIRRPVQQYYTMHDSLKAVAELMALRTLPCFTPDDDQFNYFSHCIEEESHIKSASGGMWSAPLRFLGLSSAATKLKTLTEEKVHELVCVSLVGGGDGKALNKKSIAEAMKTNQLSMKTMDGGDKFEEYVTAFLPEHLMQSKAYSSAGEILTDQTFVRRRVFSLGIMEATSRQIADVMDLRSYVGKGTSAKKVPSSPVRGAEPDEPTGGDPNFDIDEAVANASRVIIDEVYKVTNSMGVSDSLGMATCLATVGETLLKCRQPRDAMLRLEEAVSIYRGLLGPYHVYVAHALHSVAKALAKIGETRVALLKFAEAARIYEACNATLHFDSIANAQALASLLVDIGDVRKAESMFEEVISMKQAVYGDNSVQVAKTINSYAILLAKHGRVGDAMRNYEIAKNTYEQAPPPIIYDSEFEMKCSYDMTLITLNMASIYSKQGNLEKALQCYMDGVKGLEIYEGHLSRLEEARGWIDASQKQSAHKHMMAALGRIGSLKLKLGDNDAALEAYMSLINTVEDDSPLASHVEKAKAHIKCATIFRQREGSESREQSVEHLTEAKRMYSALYGARHKDTVAIDSSLKQWLAEDKKSG